MVFISQLIIIFCWIGCSLSDSSCLNGPDYWCLNSTTESLCNFTNKKIGICGYSNKRCEVKTGGNFCKSQQPTSDFDGGITGVDDNLFFYYMLSLYWPPSNCPPKYDEKLDFLRYFCSEYTDVNQPGSERLVLHGLWPTFSTKGNYQGWPQFCSSKVKDWSKCHINGNLCSWENTTKEDFSQTDYEYCLSVENIDECLVNPTEVLVPVNERLKILAPGYLGPRNLFINHELTKHGSCCSSLFGNNISNYLTHMLDLVDLFTKPGSLTYEHIQRYAGEKIGLSYLVTALNQTTIINCNSKCELEEIQMCMSRDEQTGLPKQLIQCPTGARIASDSCEKARCQYVSIPLRNVSREPPLNYACWLNIVFLLLLLILLKYFLRFYTSTNSKS